MILLYGCSSNPERARQDKILRQAPTSAESLYQQAEVLFLRGDDFNALNKLTKALELKKDFPEAQLLRANIYTKQEQYQEALSTLDEVARAKPNDAEVYALRSVVYFKQRDLPRALIEANKAVEINPASALAHSWQGRILDDLGETPKAIAAYQRALELDPQGPYAIMLHYNLGFIYLLQRDYVKCLAHWEKVNQIEPQDKAFQDRLVILRKIAKEQGLEVPKL